MINLTSFHAFSLHFFIVAGERVATADHTIMRKKLYFLLLAALLCIPALTYGFEPVTFNSGGLQYTSISDTEVMLVGPEVELGPLGEKKPGLAAPSDVTSVSVPAAVSHQGKSYVVAQIADRAFRSFISLTEVIFEDSTQPLTYTTSELFTNLPVKSLYIGRDMEGDQLISYSESLESLTFGDCVTSINNYFMFSSNPNLATLNLGNGVKTLGYSVFNYCTAIKDLVIPASVIAFEGSPFDGCTGLETVTFADSEAPLEIASIQFEDQVKEFYIGRNIVNVGGSGHLGAFNMEKVTFGGYATDIEDQMFGGRKNLKEVDFGNIKHIGSGSFYQCESLESVILPDVCETVEEGAFGSCTSLSHISLSPAMTVLKCDALGGCTSLNELEIPANIMRLESIMNGTGLETVKIADSDTPLETEYLRPFGWSPISNIYIGRNVEGLLMDDSKMTLATVTFSDKVTEVNRSMFAGCDQLINLTFGNGIKKIGDSAFQGCQGLKSVIIPESCDTIGGGAFSNCSALEDVVLPPMLVFIGNSAFSDCASLKSIDIPASVDKLEYGVFAWCTALSDLRFKDSVNPIVLEDGNFQYSPLTDIYLGRDVLSYKNLEGERFYSDSLRTVTFGDMATAVFEFMFNGNKNLKTVFLGNGVKTVGNYSFGGCVSLESMTFGSGVTEIGEQAFISCDAIRDVVSLAETAPHCAAGGQTFSEAVYEAAMLSVPRGCKPSYRETDGWKQFMKIQSAERYTVSTEYNADGGNVKINDLDVKEIIVDCDEPLTFTVTPLPGYYVKQAVINGEENVTEALQADPVLAYDQIYGDMSLDVEFAYITYGIYLSYNAEGGSVTLNGENVNCLTVRKGDDVAISVVPADGYEVTEVIVDGENVTSLFDNNTYTIKNVSADSHISVLFSEIVYPESVKLTILGLEGGSVSVMVPYGKEATLQVNADEGWIFHSLTCNGVTYDYLAGDEFMTPPMEEETTVSVVFVKYTDVNSIKADSEVRVTTRGVEIVIDGKADTDVVEIYNVGGIRLYSGYDSVVALAARGTYIVTVAGKSYKLAL